MNSHFHLKFQSAKLFKPQSEFHNSVATMFTFEHSLSILEKSYENIQHQFICLYVFRCLLGTELTLLQLFSSLFGTLGSVSATIFIIPKHTNLCRLLISPIWLQIQNRLPFLEQQHNHKSEFYRWNNNCKFNIYRLIEMDNSTTKSNGTLGEKQGTFKECIKFG